MQTGFGEKAKKRDTTRKTELGGRIILKWIFEKCDDLVFTGFIWLIIASVDGLL